MRWPPWKKPCVHSWHFCVENHSYRCSWCKMEMTEEYWEVQYGYRSHSSRHQSGTRALPVGTPGERPGGTEPAPSAGDGAGVGASMEAVAQAILAWRGWYLDLDEAGEWWLRSISMSTRWEGPTLVADKVPERDSPHGVYALRERAKVGRQGDMGNCCGEVALSGVVVEGNTGYRAERATIRRLILLGYPLPDVRPIEVMTALEDKYQCEVGWEEPTREQQIQA